MEPCLFCRIVAGEIPADIVAEGEHWLAFRDINPQAPEHVLIIPRKHIAGLADSSEEDASLLGDMMRAAVQVANELDLVEDGFRTVVNTGLHAGQTVFHLHIHVLGGRAFSWPPG